MERIHSASRLVLSMFVLGLFTNQTVAQDSKAAKKQTGETSNASTGPVLEHQLYPLLVERTMLRQKLGDDHPNVRALAERIAILKQMVVERARNEDRIVRETNNRAQQVLRNRLDELDELKQHARKHYQDSLKAEKDVILSRAALELMAQKLAESQIENRLKELEATALMTVLQEQMKDGATGELGKIHNRKEELAKQLVQQRKEQLARLEKLFSSGQLPASAITEGKTELIEAEVQFEEVRSIGNPQAEVSRKIADATVQKLVSQRMQDLLADETERINRLLRQSEAREEVNSEVQLMLEQTRDLKRQLLELETETELKSNRLHQTEILIQGLDAAASNPKKSKESPAQ